MIVLHGGSMSAEQARRNVGVERLVGQEGIVAVYPEGIGHQWNDGRRWQMGRFQKQPSSADDVAFIRAIIKRLIEQRVADSRRIYVIGTSNGGMMTLRLLCEAADIIAGVAAIAANMPVDLVTACKPVRPVATLLMNGTADTWVPYEGGGIAPGGKGQVLSTDDTIRLLRSFNGCSPDAKTELIPKRDPAGTSRAIRVSWTNCSSKVPVVLYRIEGGGHRIPHPADPSRPIVDVLLGVQNRDFDGVDAIWTFLQEIPR